MKKIFALFMAVLLAFMYAPGALSAPTVTDTSAKKEVKVRTVVISTDTITVRVDQQRTLFAFVLPTNADYPELSWKSSNSDIVIVDGDGDLRGISPGTATVTATSADGKQLATCIVTVPADITQANLYNVTDEKTPAAGFNGAVIYAAAMRADVEAAVKSAQNGLIRLTYKGKLRTSPAALRAADYTARQNESEIELRFDTLTDTGAIQGRLSINPAQYTGPDENLHLRVWAKLAYIDELAAKLGPKLSGSFAMIYCEQPGSYGMTVKIAAKPDLTGLDTTKLRLYKYNSTTGKLTLMDDAGLWLDNNGYIQFKTSIGGAYVITDREL